MQNIIMTTWQHETSSIITLSHLLLCKHKINKNVPYEFRVMRIHYFQVQNSPFPPKWEFFKKTHWYSFHVRLSVCKINKLFLEWLHSYQEKSFSDTKETHLLQTWIFWEKPIVFLYGVKYYRGLTVAVDIKKINNL